MARWLAIAHRGCDLGGDGPSASRAYTWPSVHARYTLPLLPTTGDDLSAPSASHRHLRVSVLSPGASIALLPDALRSAEAFGATAPPLVKEANE